MPDLTRDQLDDKLVGLTEKDFDALQERIKVAGRLQKAESVKSTVASLETVFNDEAIYKRLSPLVNKLASAGYLGVSIWRDNGKFNVKPVRFVRQADAIASAEPVTK